MNNKKLKILIIVLIILTIGLTGYIIYDNITEKELSNVNNQTNNNDEQEKEQNDSIENNEITNNNYSIENIYGIYGNETSVNESHLLLWNDKTYMYTYALDNQNKEGYLGTYKIENDYLILNKIFEINYGSNVISSEDDTVKIITENSIIKIKINSNVELYNENNKIKLNKLNQPFGPNNDFYSNLKNLIN